MVEAVKAAVGHATQPRQAHVFGQSGHVPDDDDDDDDEDDYGVVGG